MSRLSLIIAPACASCIALTPCSAGSAITYQHRMRADLVMWTSITKAAGVRAEQEEY
jgi:hypothetical protein